MQLAYGNESTKCVFDRTGFSWGGKEKKIMYQWRMWTGADRIGERPASDYAGESGVELHNYF